MMRMRAKWTNEKSASILVRYPFHIGFGRIYISLGRRAPIRAKTPPILDSNILRVYHVSSILNTPGPGKKAINSNLFKNSNEKEGVNARN